MVSKWSDNWNEEINHYMLLHDSTRVKCFKIQSFVIKKHIIKKRKKNWHRISRFKRLQDFSYFIGFKLDSKSIECNQRSITHYEASSLGGVSLFSYP